MSIILVVLALYVLYKIVDAILLHIAPEGYEDERGWHPGRPR